MSGPQQIDIHMDAPIPASLADRILALTSQHQTHVRKITRGLDRLDTDRDQQVLSRGMALDQVLQIIDALVDLAAKLADVDGAVTHEDSSSVGPGAVTPGSRPIVEEAGDDTSGETPAAGVVSGEGLRGNVTANVRFLVTVRSLNQKDLALRMGISEPVLSQRLTGRSRWSLNDLQKLSDIFDVEPDWFIEAPLTFMGRIVGSS